VNPNSETLGALSTQFATSVLDASWVGSTAHSRLAVDGGEGVIHGVFDGAINIFLAGGLVSLTPEAAERGPLNIMLRLPVGLGRMSSLGVRAGDKVRVRGLTLELGDRHRVSFRSAGIFTPNRKFTLPMLEEDGITTNLEVARKTALRFGNTAGLGELLAMLPPGAARLESGNLNIFASAALHRIVRLEEAFCSGDELLLKGAVTDLMGLGPGLTPSSDDMLAGLVLLSVLYSENRGSPERPTGLIARATSAQARGRTTLLSEEYLMQAALGRGNESPMRLCAALLSGGRKSVERETKRVLSIGETSGTDTVLGILLGTMLCMGRRSGLAWRESE
jgi:hypothetical protein